MLGPGPRLMEKEFTGAAVSQRLRNTGPVHTKAVFEGNLLLSIFHYDKKNLQQDATEEKLRDGQTVNTSPTFHETRSFVTVFATARKSRRHPDPD